MKNSDIYAKVTKQIIDIIDIEGTLPWQKSWNFNGLVPCNYVSKRPYRGINLIMTAYDKFQSPYYMTANQIKKAGGTWKGKGTLIVFWQFKKYTEKRNGKDEVVKTIPFLKYYYVWNEEQIEGIEFKKPEKHELNTFGEISEVEDILSKMPNKPEILHYEQDRAYYSPINDKVVMPVKGQFNSLEDYYSVFAHELIHSTGHKDRLAREGVTNPVRFGSHDYSKEELVAEMGASFIMGLAGIEQKTINNSASYIKGWKRKLEDDPKILLQSASQAQKAVDYILGEYKGELSTKAESSDTEKAMAI